MARTNRTDKIRADLTGARAALAAIERELKSDAPDAATIAAAAKNLEAFGCYVRRTKIGD